MYIIYLYFCTYNIIYSMITLYNDNVIHVLVNVCSQSTETLVIKNRNRLLRREINQHCQEYIRYTKFIITSVLRKFIIVHEYQYSEFKINISTVIHSSQLSNSFIFFFCIGFNVPFNTFQFISERCLLV